jgi:L-fuconolactonase
VLPKHLPALLELTARYPDLSMVLDHGAKPPISSGDLGPWKQAITELARSTPMVCKLSGLVTEAASAEATALEDSVEHLLGAFGPARMMWGSDWPVCELVCSYGDWCNVSDGLLGKLEAHEREQIYSGTARATYGI